MGQVIFVVARESVEALLVIGILWAWMKRDAKTERGKKWLIGGIFAGLGLAVLLALTLVGITTFLGGSAQTWFEIGMLAFASALIVQMVVWMRQHGHTLRDNLETELRQSVEKSSWWGVFLLTMIAVGREGSETVMFLYGNFLSLQSTTDYLFFAGAALIGLILALLLFYALQIGERFISWRTFFTVTEVILLFLGCALLLQATEKLMNGPLATIDLPAWMYSTMWDTSQWLNDSSFVGNLFASLFAYRARPIGLDLVIFMGYWLIIIAILYNQHRRAQLKSVVGNT